jgi:enediyne biosynthesis protein E4
MRRAAIATWVSLGVWTAVLGGVTAPGRAGAASPGPFTDVTAAAGADFAHMDTPGPFNEARHVAGGVACGDFDGDGDLYLVCGDAAPNVLLRNQRDGTFADVAGVAGVAIAGANGAGPTFADYDGDGDLDLLVLGVGTTRPRLFAQDGASAFRDVTVAAGLAVTHDAYSAAFGDPDRDGDLDVVISHWATPLTAAPTELYWSNRGDGTFVEASAATGIIPVPVVSSPPVPAFDFSFTPTFADLDDDGWSDLVLASDFGTSRVFRNEQNGRLRDVTTAVISDENGMGSAVGDVDGDGILDWFVSSIWDPAGTTIEHWGVSGNRLYRGRGDATFDDHTDAAGVRIGYWGWGSTLADLDNDGDLDLAHTNGWFSSDAAAAFQADPTRLFVGAGDGTFTEAAVARGVDDHGMGRGIVAFDYDRDGDLDLFVANNNGSPRLLRNDLAAGGHFLALRLHGAAPNTQAVGARVWVTAGGRTQVREVRAGSNFESQDPAEVHVGLGSAGVVDRVRVRWPDGNEVERTGVAVDRFLDWSQTAVACADSAGGRCVVGGRAARSDCLVRTQVAARRVHSARAGDRVTCQDGDPGCDHDGEVGSCTFSVALCVGGAAPGLPKCAAAAGAEVTLELAATAAPVEAALRTAVTGLAAPPGSPFVPIDPTRCTEAVPVRVSLARRGRRTAPGSVQIRLSAGAGGRRDIDRLTLRCQPAGR